MILAKDSESFKSAYGFDPGVDGFKLSLNNGGDKLELKEGDVSIDYVEWETYDLNWSLHADEGQTIQRTPVNLDTDSPDDWMVGQPTPGQIPASTTTTTGTTSTTESTTSTTESSTTSESTQSTTTIHYNTPDLILTEVCYDTPGNDNIEEWVEITNKGEDIQLQDIVLEDGKGTYNLPEIQLQSQDTLVLARNLSGFQAQYNAAAGIYGLTLSLNNNGDKLTLKSGGIVLDELAWEDYIPGWDLKAKTGECLQRDGDGWIVSDTPTPGVTDAHPTTTTTTTTTLNAKKRKTTTTTRSTTSTIRRTTTSTRKTTSTTMEVIRVSYRFTNPIRDACQDGLRNQGEDGVDCGGPCSPCPTTTSTTIAQSHITREQKTSPPPTGYSVAIAGTGGGLIGGILTLGGLYFFTRNGGSKK